MPSLETITAANALRYRSLIASILLYALAACGSSSEQAARKAAEAQAFLSAGNVQAAQESISAALLLRDDVPDYYILAGNIKLAAQDQVGAYMNFRSAVDLDAANVAALEQYCILGAQMGRYDDANGAADTLLAINPSSMAGLQTKGIVALSRNRFDVAADYAQRLIRLSPNDPVARTLNARVMLKNKDPEGAAKELEAGLAANGDNVLLLFNRLNLARSTSNKDVMAATFAQLMRLMPGNLDVTLDYADFLYRTGHADQARERIAQVVADPRLTPAQTDMVVQLWSEHDTAPVTPLVIEQLMKADPEVIRPICNYLLSQNMVNEAQDIAKALPAQKANIMRGMLSRIALASGDSAGARSTSNAVLDKDDRNVDALITRSMLEMSGGKVAEAIVDLQTVVQEDPRSYVGFDQLARAYMAKSDKWRAQQIYGQAIKALPQNHFLQENYLSFLHQIGDNGRAMATADLFSKASPASVRGWDRFAKICAAQSNAGCTAKAKAGRDVALKLYGVDFPPGGAPRMGLFGRF
jgi:Tfp pilus assembly protein PilF